MNKLLSSHLYNNTDFYLAFKKDLQTARHSVLIESPFITTRRMNKLLPVLRSLRQKNVRVAINTRDPIEHNEVYAAQARTAVLAMQELDITVLYTAGHHRKLAIIDGKVLWEGSLNILSQNDSCEIMRRTISKRLVKQMVRFIGAKRWL